MHENSITLSKTQAHDLIVQQAPQYAHLSLSPLNTAGTVNYIYRLGDSLTVRFPIQKRDPNVVSQQLQQEFAAMEEFFEVSPFRAPEPIFIGKPSRAYPMPWLIQTWVPGDVTTPYSVAHSTQFAEDLVHLISSLRKADTRGRTFQGTNRGGDLSVHDDWMEECFRQSEGLLDTTRMRSMWKNFRTLPREDPDCMSHTDLIPFNLLSIGGRLTGILDTGDYQAADPALDLVAAWHMLEREPRELLRKSLRCNDLQWERGKAWAFQQATGLVWYYQDSNPDMANLGRTTLKRLMAEDNGGKYL